MRSVRLHDLAQEELERILEWYARNGASEAVLDDFMSAYRKALAQIATEPIVSPPHLFGTRRYQLTKFPHGIIFRVGAETIYILAVAHPKQRPGYWKDRDF